MVLMSFRRFLTIAPRTTTFLWYFFPWQSHFRFGHSLLKPTFKRMDTKYADAGPALKLADMFFNPESLHEPGMLDDLMRGMSATSMETLDQVWSPDDIFPWKNLETIFWKYLAEKQGHPSGQ